MKSTSIKAAASAATLLTLAVFLVTAPAAGADEYCLKGPQAAHACGFTSMEMCRADSSGMGGTCSLVPSSKAPSDALAYHPRQLHARHELRRVREPAARAG